MCIYNYFDLYSLTDFISSCTLAQNTRFEVIGFTPLHSYVVQNTNNIAYDFLAKSRFSYKGLQKKIIESCNKL